MASYVDPAGTKFWEIEREGATVVRRSGTVGTRGRSQSRTFASALLARFNAKNFAGYKTHTERYRRVDAPAPSRLDDDMPATDDARLVHADLLQQRGDPLGELIVLQHQDQDTRAFIDAHATTWFGDLADARDQFEVTWRLGRLERVALHPDGGLDALLPDVPHVYKLPTLVDALFDLPIARSLEELVVGNAGTTDYQATMLAIVEGAPPTLRRLEIDADARRQAADAWLAPMRFPNLEDFHCDPSLTALALHHVASAQWPKLESLWIAMHGSHAAQPPEDVTDSIAALAPLLACEGIPALRKLDIWTPVPTQLARAMTKLPSQLARVTIRSTHAIDAAAERDLPSCARFDQQPMFYMRR